ncbi:MAG: hypothetical protein ACRYF4_03355 [Janthinobacterium lividum]
MVESAGAHQVHTLELFLALWLARSAWPGSLLLGVGLGPVGRALALASVATGAAGLFLESEPDALRAAHREGCCTFTVSTLEEAVRALKNEVRQKRAISIALRGNVAANLREMVYRGIQPDVLAFSRPALAEELSATARLLQRGTVGMQGFGLAPMATFTKLEPLLENGLGTSWQIGIDVAADMAERGKLDRARVAASANLPADSQSLNAAAYRWARVAPSLFPRSRERAYLSSCSCS